MTDFYIPAASVGPGSQPPEPDGAELDIMQLPSGMNTYMPPPLPEPEVVAGRRQALELLEQLRQRLAAYRVGRAVEFVSLEGLDAANLEIIDQVLGEGEVSVVCRHHGEVRIQEAVMAGIWRVRQYDEKDRLVDDRIEIGAAPSWVQERAFEGAEVPDLALKDELLPPGVLNAPPLIAEIIDKLEHPPEGEETHVINLTLLPQTEEDLGFLAARLGEGRVTILSRGYGNCRITSTATPNVWWVQYFNSQDRNILNTIEITPVPEVACAAQEDIDDSAVRLAEILEIYQ